MYLGFGARSLILWKLYMQIFRILFHSKYLTYRPKGEGNRVLRDTICSTCSCFLPRKTISSALFMFFATFTSTLALGEHIKESTNGLIGLNEYLMMNSAAGMLHSIIGCQPLLVLRPTGPITLLFEKLLTFADQHSLPFWPFFAWTGIFVGLLMFLIAAFEVSKYVKHLTLFTENIFATFIGIVYINDGIQGMIRLWENPPVGDSLPHSRYGSQDAASKLLTLSLGWNSWIHLFRGDKKHHRCFFSCQS